MNRGALTDLTGNAFEGLTVSQALNFKTTPSNPILTWSNLWDEQTLFSGLEADENIVLSFDEAVIAGKGVITISSEVDTRAIDVKDRNQVIFDENGNVIINPADDLLADTRYTIQVARGVILDTRGNPYIGISNPEAYSFTTITENLQLVRSSIGFNTSLIDWISLHFNETVLPGNGKIIIKNESETHIIDIHDVSQIRFDINSVFINPQADLQPNTNYNILIDSGAITDTGGKPYAGIQDPQALHLITYSSESVAPVLTSINTFDTFGHKVDHNIVLDFNEPIATGNGAIIISSALDTRIIDINDSSQVFIENGFGGIGTLIIDPATDLALNTNYHIQIPSGAIQDIDGNFFAGINDPDILSFKTITSDPLLAAVNHSNQVFVNNALLKIDDELELYFDEEVMPANGSIIISNGTDTRTIDIHDTSQVTFLRIDSIPGSGGEVTFSSSKTVTINPVDDLIANTNYSVQISSNAITDTEGNAYAGISDLETLSFKTIGPGPLLIHSNTSNSSSGFLTDSDIVLTFDESLITDNGTVIISSETDKRIIAIHDSNQITLANERLFINPLNDLQPDTRYSIEITPGAITDTEGSPYEGTDDLVTLNFITAGSVQELMFL